MYRSFGITAHTWDHLGSLRDGQQYHDHVSDLHLHYHDVWEQGGGWILKWRGADKVREAVKQKMLYFMKHWTLGWILSHYWSTNGFLPEVGHYYCMSFHASICLPMHPHVYPCIHMSIHASTCLFMHPSVHPCLHLSIHASLCLTMHQYVYMCIHLSIHASICLSVHPSV